MKPIFNHKKLIFNNYLAEDLGFIVVEGPPEILAQEQYELIEVEGRNGNLLVNKGTYPDLEKTFTITTVDYLETEDIPAMMEKIKQWFFDITDNRLFYAYSDRYNIVRKVIFTEDIKTSFEEFGDFQVTFLCEPFYYLDNEEDIVIEANSKGEGHLIYENKGDLDSYPILKIHGIGDISFGIVDLTTSDPMIQYGIQVKNVDSYVEIDSKLLTCIDKNGNNKSADVITGFVTLNRGKCEIWISASSNVSKVEITPRTIFR